MDVPQISTYVVEHEKLNNQRASPCPFFRTHGIHRLTTYQQMQNDDLDWTMIIQPHRGWFDVRLGELWQYRYLIRQFVWRDFVAVYKQTILGPLWYLIQAVLTAATFTVIFGRIAKLPTDGLPPFLFYMSGVVIWRYFADCLTKTSDTFTKNAGIFGKVYFPRLVMPISILFSNLISFAIQLLQLFGFMVYFHIAGAKFHPNAWLLLTPLLILLMAGIGLGLGIIVSALTTRYRDLQNLVKFGVQLLMYATTVIFPLSAVPEKYQWIIILNPITPIIEMFRFAFLGTATVGAFYLLYSAGFMIVVLSIGIIIFNRVERNFMDTV